MGCWWNYVRKSSDKMSEEKRTEVSEIGEFGLIDHLSKGIQFYNEGTVRGIGDDAAVLDIGDEYLVTTTDMLVEGVHFDLSYVPLHHLGYKAIAVNVSDLAAMNATPRQVTVSLALSNRFSVEALEVLYQGIRQACEAYRIDFVGGDTTASRSGLVISVTALGTVAKNKIAYRSGAQVNDILCVTGDLGGAYIGLQILEREKQEFLSNPDMQPQLDKYPYVVGRQLKPEARMNIIYELADQGIIPTSMIDVSDGLASEIFHLCKQSGVGAAVYEDKLPIDKETYETAAEFSIDPNTCALNGGEDYELLFTLRQEDFDKIKNHPDIHTIGYLHDVDKGKVMVTRGGHTVPLQAQGWKHF